MNIPRRGFLHLGAASAALAINSRVAWADVYPSRPLHMIVDIPAGLAPDVLARLLADPLSHRLGQDVIVEDRPGAGGNVGAEYVIRSAPDGYTLLVMISGNAANAALYPNLDFNFVRDIVPVAFLGYTPFVVVVHPTIPATTIPELVAYAKANPGKLNLASQGAGTAPHLAFELFKMMTGVNIVHVPYRVSYLPDLLAGQVQLAFATVPPVLGYIHSGKLHALGVTSAKPMEALPDVPAIAQSLPGYEGSGWAGVGAPHGTPGDIVDTLNKAINPIIADPAFKARALALGAEPEPMTPSQFGTLMTDAARKWAKVIAFANIKVD
ncbi:MAG TPA: tripartite tricarboxylate transporter substrate binding protein [Xanthobacteraceae bacterium]|jgi:tripartite-type tricarboxylate transporter receptor subunit TctC|nr:tripartite tricarboxylate transporter substrate binding protein [Xanthobacteraceae bacterium]